MMEGRAGEGQVHVKGTGIEACSLNFCDLLFGHEKTLPPASITVEDFALGGTR